MRARMTASFGMLDNSFNPIWAFSRRRGEVWKLLLQILNGAYRTTSNKKSGRLTSISKFVAMQGLSDSQIKNTLDRVAKKYMTLNDMHESFVQIKALAAIRVAIMEILNLTSWSDAVEKFPITCDIDFMRSWIATFTSLGTKTKKKLGLPSNFAKAVEERRAMDRDVRKHAKKKKVGKVLVAHVICCC